MTPTPTQICDCQTYEWDARSASPAGSNPRLVYTDCSNVPQVIFPVIGLDGVICVVPGSTPTFVNVSGGLITLLSSVCCP
jgi:hypothetical protein